MTVQFLIGDWVREPASGRIGRVISRRDFHEPVVRWLSGEVECCLASQLEEYHR